MSWRESFERAISISTGLPVWLRYALTLAFVCGVGVFWSQVNIDRPFLLFFPTILICAVFLNRGSGFIATFAAALFSAVYLLPPFHSPRIDNVADQISLGLFVIVGLMMSGLAEALRLRVSELSAEKEKSEKLAVERQLLAEELAHRTRNDLSNVVTLLNLQASSVPEVAREALTAAAERVRTIARVHRRLEIVGERVVVDSKPFFDELCADLHLSRLSHRPIHLDCSAESHSIGIAKAVPLGLIVNELITNAAKHAFPEDRAGHIKVRFVRRGSVYVLTVEDDGVGPAGVGHKGTGLRLLHLLASQLGSGFESGPRENGTGTRAVINVPVKVPNREPK